MNHLLQEIRNAQKSGIKRGVCSVCTANPLVIEACMELCMEHGQALLLEATANQANQFGGYTGMTPEDFRNAAWKIADKVGFQRESLILGGDHLGPFPWRTEPEAPAMKKAEALIRGYVLSGFTKIHIDTSMRLGDDNKSAALELETIARRGAALAYAAEDAYQELLKTHPNAQAPDYVIGSEVPVPGGTEHETMISVTTPSEFANTIAAFRTAYEQNGLQTAWDRVIGIVVQPGVEFSDEIICEYDPNATAALTKIMDNYPDLILEGHSTDYQTKGKLRQMVCDGIAILKVGPALTFALRESLFALANMEKERFFGSGLRLSNFIEVLEAEMLSRPSDWKNYCHGDAAEQMFSRKYGFSDRARYYLSAKNVQEARDILFANQKVAAIPLGLLSQYMPIQYEKVRNGKFDPTPEALVMDWIKIRFEDYLYAVAQ